jgi:hypothetical protein
MGGTSGSFMFCTNEIKGSKFEAQPWNLWISQK